MENVIREFALDMGVDDIGFMAAKDYKSPATPPIENLFPQAESIIVLTYRELSSCESPSPHIAMNGRLDMMEFSRSCNYKLARFLTKNYNARTMTIPISYPMDLGDARAHTAELSLRHAAVGAGLGSFGRHNIVIHPLFGTRVCFTAILTDLKLKTFTGKIEETCINCDLCVKNCPANALEKPGQTNVGRCIKNSQPYGMGGAMSFWEKFASSNSDEQKKMLRSETYRRLYQNQFIGLQYFCFNCMKSCPIGQ